MNRPQARIDAKASNDDLLAWATDIVARAQDNRIFGTVTVHVENGRITRVITASSEVPEN